MADEKEDKLLQQLLNDGFSVEEAKMAVVMSNEHHITDMNIEDTNNQWACSKCTLLNKSHFKACDACGKTRIEASSNQSISSKHEWWFAANSEFVRKFKSEDNTLWSGSFMCQDHELYIRCDFIEGSSSSLEPTLSLYPKKLPANTEKLRATIKFVCEEIGYDVSCTQNGGDVWTVPRATMQRNKFNDLNEWTFKCEITTHGTWKGPPKIDENLIIKMFEKSFQTLLNDVNYKKTIYWLLTICQSLLENPNNKQYQQIFCKDIKTKLRKQKYEQFFEKMVMWSGFRKNSMDNYTHWIYDKSALQRTMWVFAFWNGNIYHHTKEIHELIDEGFTAKEINEAIIESLIDEDCHESDADAKDDEQKYDPIPIECKSSSKLRHNIARNHPNQTLSTDAGGITPLTFKPVIKNNNMETKPTIKQEEENIIIETNFDMFESKQPLPVNSAYILDANTIYDGNKCDDKAENCKQFTDIQNILNNYSDIIYSQSENKTETNIENIYDENYNDIDLLNDFNHLLLYHSDEYEQIYNILNVQKQCDLLKCVSLRRNHRNRNIDNNTSYLSHDAECIVRQQLLDRVHSYFYHGFDTGHRLTHKERNIVVQQHQNTNNNENDHDIDYTFLAVKKLTKGKKTSVIESNTDKFNVKINKNKYSHGFRYFYWDWYKNNHLTNDPAIQDFKFATNIGDNIDPKQRRIYNLGEWYIKEKFDNLKDELTNTKKHKHQLCTLTMDQYKHEQNKAQKMLQTHICREMKCVRKDSKKLYELVSGQEIEIKHILAMMVYCNTDKIQYEFTKTFRFTDEIKSNEELKERHRNYYYLGRYLRELVECFGMKYSSKNFHLYHGINTHFTFSSINGFINGPLSTTRSYEVAINFSANAGMVLKFEIMTDNWVINNKKQDEKHLSCFDCQFLSDYGNEHEIFFIGGTKYFSFSNIIDTRKAIFYERYIKGIRQMTFSMNNGVTFFDYHNAPKTKVEQQMVSQLLLHEIWRVTNGKMGSEFECCPEYIKDILHQHCQNIIIIELWTRQRDWCDRSIEHEKLLINNDRWIKLDLILKIFPNARVIRCDGSNMHLSCIDGNIIAQSVLALLHNNSGTMLDELQVSINFKWYEQIKNAIDPYREEIYDRYNWIVYYCEDCSGVVIMFYNTNNMVNLF